MAGHVRRQYDGISWYRDLRISGAAINGSGVDFRRWRRRCCVLEPLLLRTRICSPLANRTSRKRRRWPSILIFSLDFWGLKGDFDIIINGYNSASFVGSLPTVKRRNSGSKNIGVTTWLRQERHVFLHGPDDHGAKEQTSWYGSGSSRRAFYLWRQVVW